MAEQCAVGAPWEPGGVTAVRLPAIGPFSVEDWLASDPDVDGSRVELIFGYPHVTPPPSGEHQRAAYRLTRQVDDALQLARRPDLHVVSAVNVRISTAWRTALIPDVVVLNRKPVGPSFDADALALVAEIHPSADRETRMAAYAAANVPFLWTVGERELCAYRLENSQYRAENTVTADCPATITAAPTPITLDLAELLGWQQR
jgi:Uma2 family endonuclease